MRSTPATRAASASDIPAATTRGAPMLIAFLAGFIVGTLVGEHYLRRR